MMEDAVRARLLDQVTALGTRVFPQKLPQPTAPNTDPATLPAAVYQRVSTPPHVTLDGANALRGPRIRVDVWDETYGGVRTVATAVRSALDPGTFVARTAAGTSRTSATATLGFGWWCPLVLSDL